MKFRKAKIKDAGKIAKVLTSFYNMRIGEAKNAFLSELKKGHNFIVAENEEIIGLASWIAHGLCKHELAELDRIVVNKENRGKRIGEKLVENLIKDAQAYFKKNGFRLRKLYLMSHANNKEAHKFYKKMGFKLEAILKAHYYKGKDEYIFSMFFN